MVNKELNLTVVDAGARYGIHPTWKPVQKIVNFKLFEVDPNECTRLRKKYSGINNIEVFDLALASKSGDLQFTLREHRGLTSIYEVSDDVINNNYKSREFREFGKFVAKSISMDEMFPSNNIDFLKLDVEGAELDILNGSHNLLKSSILGVRSEVCFAPVYQDAPLFGDIDKKLRDFKFQLINLDYDGKGAAKNEFSLENKYGRLVSTDGVWVKPTQVLLDDTPINAAQNVIKTSLFLILNNATDLAVDLLAAANSNGLNLIQFENNLLFIEMKRRLALLFKLLLDKPQYGSDQIIKKWNELFNEEFPIMSAFWESNLANE